MTVHELERAQERYLPEDDLKPFAGQWIAVRDGHVVASDLDPVALRSQPEVRETDLLMPVPATGDGLFIL